MVDALWEEVVASSSMTDLAGRLASYPLDSLPSFAAFFWTADGMRSLVRGAVSVVDLASGVTVAEGEGIQTWSEVGLGQVSQVLVDVQTAGNGARAGAAAGRRRRTCVLGPVGRVARGSRRSPQVALAQAPAEDDSADQRSVEARRRGVGYAERPPYASRRPRTPRTGPVTPPAEAGHRLGPDRADPRARSPGGTRRGLGGTGGHRADVPAVGAAVPVGELRRPAPELSSARPALAARSPRPGADAADERRRTPVPDDGTLADTAPAAARQFCRPRTDSRSGIVRGARSDRYRSRTEPCAGSQDGAGRGDGERRHPADAAAAVLSRRRPDHGASRCRFRALRELADHGRGLPVRPRQRAERHRLPDLRQPDRPAGSAAATAAGAGGAAGLRRQHGRGRPRGTDRPGAVAPSGPAPGRPG